MVTSWFSFMGPFSAVSLTTPESEPHWAGSALSCIPMVAAFSIHFLGLNICVKQLRKKQVQLFQNLCFAGL